jgi:hypothetical protein
MLRGFIALLCVCTSIVSASAQEFSIESKVYDGRDLTSSSTTLFVDGKAYNFLGKPDETVVMSPKDGRIVLLDNTRRMRTDLTTNDVVAFCEQLRMKAERASSEALQFYAAPDFTEKLDAETQEVVLHSPYMEYRAKMLSPPTAAVLKSYEDYALWQARLNAAINPGAPPPNARQKLNDALARRQSLPSEVSLKRTSIIPGFGKTLRAEHLYTWRLDDPDRRRIAQADERLATYKTVPLAEYLRPAVESAKR